MSAASPDLLFSAYAKKCNTRRIFTQADCKNIAPQEHIRQITIYDGWPIIFFSKRKTKIYPCPLSEMTQTFLFHPGLKIKDAINHSPTPVFYYDVTRHFIYLKCSSYITFFRRGDNTLWLFFPFIDRSVWYMSQNFFFIFCFLSKENEKQFYTKV